MGVHSGKWGAIDIESTVRDWMINDNMTPSEYVVSGSLAGRVRVEGITNWDGTYNQVKGEPALLPGLSGAAQFYTAPDDDVLGSAGVLYSGNILVSQVQVNWDWAASEAINNATTFVGDGDLTIGSGIVQDSVVPDIDPICPAKIEFSTDGLAWTSFPNLATAQLTLTCDVIDYVNSSTNCGTGRKAGPIDWTLALTQEDNIRVDATQVTKGANYYIRCWIDDTLYWYLAFGMVRDFTGITVNIETGEVISQTINIDMNGSDGTTLGGVISPSGVQWWNAGHTPPGP